MITKSFEFVEGSVKFSYENKTVHIFYEAQIFSKGNYELKYQLEDITDGEAWDEIYPEYDDQINMMIKVDIECYLENKPVPVISVTKADVEGSGYKDIDSNTLDEIATRMESGCMYNYWESLKIACENLGLEKK